MDNETMVDIQYQYYSAGNKSEITVSALKWMDLGSILSEMTETQIQTNKKHMFPLYISPCL